MRLSAIFLNDVAGVNIFRESEQLEMTEGDTVTVYVQLRDVSVNTSYEGYKNPGRRYMPLAGATLQVKFDTLDDAWVPALTKTAVQPFPQDPSIWMFQILATDPIKGTGRLKLILNEGGKKTYGLLDSAVLVSSAS